MSSPSPSKRLKTENNGSNNDNNQSNTSHQDTRTQATDDQPAAAHPDSNSQSESSTTRTSPRILQLQRQRQRQRELQSHLETQRQRERDRQSEAESSQNATRRNQTTSTSNRNQNHPESISDSPPSCSSTSNPSIIPSTPTSSRRNNSGRRVLHLNPTNNNGQGSTSNPDNPAADPPNGGGRVRTPLEEIPLWWADERGDEIRRNRQTVPTSDPGPSALEINSSSSSVTRGGHRSARLRRGHHGPNLQVPILSSSNNPSSSPSFSPHTPSRRANRNQLNEEATTLPESPSAGREGLSLTRSNRRNLPFTTPSRGREDSDSRDRDRGRRSLQNHQAEASSSRNRLTSSSSTPSSSASSLNDRNRRAENREIIRNTSASPSTSSSSNLTTTNNEGSLRRTTRSGNVFGNILPLRRNRSQTPSSSNAPNDENSHSLEDQPSTSTPSSRTSNRRSDRNREDQGEVEVGGSSFESSLDDTPDLINHDSSIGDDSSSSGFIVPPSPMRRNIGRNQGRGIPSSSSTSTSDPSSNPPSSSTPRLRRSRNSTATRTFASTTNLREEGTSIAGSTRSRRNLQDSERGGQEEEGQIIDQSQALSSQPRNEAASDNNSLRNRPSNPQFRINDLPSSSSDNLDSESTALDRLAASAPDRVDFRKPNENVEEGRDRLSLEETR